MKYQVKINGAVVCVASSNKAARGKAIRLALMRVGGKVEVWKGEFLVTTMQPTFSAEVSNG
jgi:hypothetical protein